MKKQRSDTVAGMVKATQAHSELLDVPEGLECLTEREKTAWNQYILARDNWKELELRGLHRIVKLETELQKMFEESRELPKYYEKVNGDMTEHPIHGTMRNTQKLLHSELRVVGLQVTRERANTTNSGGKEASKKTSSAVAKLVG